MNNENKASSNIYLIGFMGAGKSTVATALQDLYGYQVAEMDQMIVEESGMPISQIFEQFGEPVFRAKETDLLRRLAKLSGKVISCGGGAAMKEENVAIMKQGGIVVLLEADPAVILERVRDDHSRPLLENNKTIEHIESLMASRLPRYHAAADYTISVNDKTPEEIAKEIAQICDPGKDSSMTQEITGHTGLLALLGSPVSHSISPQMHNLACKELGLDYAYLAFDADEAKMPAAVEALKTLGARGWNITMPGKNIMCELADIRSKASEISGACNTIVNDRGQLTAYTTDGIGFMRALGEYGFDPIGKNMTLLGGGGAATAILVQAALDGVSEIDVFNLRDAFYPRLEEIAAKLNQETSCKVRVHDFDDPQQLADAIKNSALLVNGTSVGMAPNTERSLITDLSLLRPDLFVFDVIYNPKETKLLRDAKAAGCRTGNGLYMLLYQGAASFELWTGKEMPVETIKKAYFDQK